MLKRYYSLDEAIEFLTSELKTPFTERDILDLQKREQLSLCFYRSIIFGIFKWKDDGSFEPQNAMPTSVDGYFHLFDSDIYESSTVQKEVRFPSLFENIGRKFTDTTEIGYKEFCSSVNFPVKCLPRSGFYSS